MHFEMAKHGSVFSTRDRSIALFRALEIAEAKAKKEGDLDLTLDFSKVNEISDSFADAFVARLFMFRADRGASKPQLTGMNSKVSTAVSWAFRMYGLSV